MTEQINFSLLVTNIKNILGPLGYQKSLEMGDFSHIKNEDQLSLRRNMSVLLWVTDHKIFSIKALNYLRKIQW